MSGIGAFVDSFHDHFTRDPNACVVLGVEKHLAELPDPTLEACRSRLDEARTLVEAVDRVARDALSFDQSLDLDLAKLMLEAEIHTDSYQLDGGTRLERLPTTGDDIGDGVFMMLVNDPRPAGDRLDDITSRLERVPDYTEAALGRLETPVRRWVQMDLDTVRGLPELFDSVVAWGEREEWTGTTHLRKVVDRAREALEAYSKRLSETPTTTALHVGTPTAERIVALRGIEKPLAEIHRIAIDFLADNAAAIEELRGRLASKHGLDPTTSVRGVEKFLHEKYAVRVTDGDFGVVLRRYEAEREKILAFIEERSLFPLFDEQEMEVLRTPAFLEPTIPAGAMVSPAPFRDGVKRSLVYLTLSEELLDEHTELSIPNMMIHEGIPGHHLQLAHAARHPSVIRRHVDAMDQAEGWTTMLEDYMLDIGYLPELTDEARFVGKRDIARIGARVAIDLFFMTGDRSYLEVGVDFDLTSEDPFEVAGNLLRKVTGFVPGRVQTELNWYSKERGYPLSYLTGNRLVWELKQDFAKKQSSSSSTEIDRAFHRQYVEAGSMPVSYLRRLFAHRDLV